MHALLCDNFLICLCTLTYYAENYHIITPHMLKVSYISVLTCSHCVKYASQGASSMMCLTCHCCQDIEKYNELIEKIIEETDKLSSSVIGGMANVPNTLLALVQALEDGDTPDSWLFDDEPKKLSDYFKGKLLYHNYLPVCDHIS